MFLMDNKPIQGYDLVKQCIINDSGCHINPHFKGPWMALKQLERQTVHHLPAHPSPLSRVRL